MVKAQSHFTYIHLSIWLQDYRTEGNTGSRAKIRLSNVGQGCRIYLDVGVPIHVISILGYVIRIKGKIRWLRGCQNRNRLDANASFLGSLVGYCPLSQHELDHRGADVGERVDRGCLLPQSLSRLAISNHFGVDRFADEKFRLLFDAG